MNRVLLTGCSGIIGRAITRRLLQEDFEITAFLLPDIPSTKSYRASFPTVHIIEGDLSHIQAINFGSQDAVIHLAWAGTTSMDRLDNALQKQNYDWSMAVLDVAKATGAKTFIFAGSQAEYGKAGQHGIETEDVLPEPFTAYGKEKLRFGESAEAFCHENDIRFVHPRIFSVYGPNDRPNSLLSSLVSAEVTGSTVQLGPCTHRWNFLHEDDLAALFYIALSNQNCSGIINFVSDDTRVLRDFVQSAFSPSTYRFGETNPNPEGLIELNPSLDKLKKVIGDYPFIRFEDAIQKMIADKKVVL